MSVAQSFERSTKRYPMASNKAAISKEPDDIIVVSQEHYGDEQIDENVPASVDNNDKQTESKELFSSWSDMCRVCANVNDHIIPIFDAEGAEHELSKKIHKYLPIRVYNTDTLPVQLCYHCAATILAWHELLEGCLNAEKRLLQLQAEQSSREQAQAEYSENLGPLSEEMIDGTESPVTNKQESSSNVQEDEETNCVDSSICDEATTRFDKARETFRVFLETHESCHRSERLQIQVRNCTWKENYETINQSDAETADEDPLRLINEPITSRRGRSRKTKICKKTSIKKSSDYQETYNHDYNDVDSSPTDEKKIATKCSASDEEFSKNIRQAVIDTKEHENLNSESAAINLYKCHECPKVFRLKDSYIRHQRIHRDERPFTCHVCGKQFRDSGGLSRHLKDVHARVKNFSCDICSKCFSSKATRDDHRRTHTGERPYACDNCDKSFKSRACLYIHSKLHTDQFPYPCAHCEKKFRRRQEMLVHVSTHTGEKNHSCDICSRRFRVKTELTRHKLTHSNEKPYICAKCGLSFRQNRYLNNHVKSRHSHGL